MKGKDEMIKILKKGNTGSMVKICRYCNCVFTFDFEDIETDDFDHGIYIKCPQCKLRIYPYNY